MTVLILERVSASLRGEITRWLLELRPGVFVGRVSALVRDRLWEKVESAAGSGGAILLYAADREQQFCIRTRGGTSRRVTDFDGLALITTPES